MAFNKNSCDYCGDVTQAEKLSLGLFYNGTNTIERQIVFNIILNKVPIMYGDQSLKDEVESWPLYRFNSIFQWKEVCN